MCVQELIDKLSEWDPYDEVKVIIKCSIRDEEYNIEYVGEYYDYSYKEGGSSPAITCYI